MNSLRSQLLVTASAVAITCSSLASADPYDHHGHDDYRGHDDHHYHGYSHGHEGHWYHGDHGGHFGWWWIAADMWYFYPAPIYPYPNPYAPPAIVIEPEPAPPREAVWYYCNSSRNYYPYVSVCPEGWRAVPAEPRDADER